MSLFEHAAKRCLGWYRTQTIDRQHGAGHADGERPLGRQHQAAYLESICQVHQH